MIICSFSVSAAENSPYKLLDKIGHKLFNDIAELSAEQRQQPKVMRELIVEDLMPYIDYRYTAYKILGKYVKTATKKQRNAFVEVMRNSLVDTYAQALTKYKNQQVKFERSKKTSNKRIVMVRTEIVEQGAPTINIAFKFRKSRRTGKWKAFDMVVEGISLLSSKQAEIIRQIRNSNLDNVIEKLRKKSINA